MSLREKVSERVDFKRWRYRFRNKKRSVKRFFDESVLPYFEYLAQEFAPYILAYGVLLNFPLYVLLDFKLTGFTVVSWGLVFYLVSEELSAFMKELRPFVKVDAEVKN